MPSGIFRTVAISSIVVDRPNRQRRDLGDIPSLAESIRERGLIHPPVVTNEMVLIAGERRLSACRSLGWDQISVQVVTNPSELELQAIELEENIKRQDISWQDRARAIESYHKLRGLSQPATARELGLSQTVVNKHLAVAKELHDPKIANAPKFSVAQGLVERRNERRDSQSMAQVKPSSDGPSNIITTNFAEWVATYSGPRFNFIHCDFPYGIGAQSMRMQNAVIEERYDDDAATYFDLIDCLLGSLPTIASDSCHVMFWFSMKFYRETMERLSRVLAVDPFPMIWFKSDNAGVLPDPTRGPRRVYETAFLCSLGDRKIVQAVANTFAAPTQRDIHMSEKSETMLRHFFRMFVDEESTVLDPTCGSGSAIRAAEGLKAKYVLGLELNAEFAERARQRLEEARRIGK